MPEYTVKTATMVMGLMEHMPKVLALDREQAVHIVQTMIRHSGSIIEYKFDLEDDGKTIYDENKKLKWEIEKLKKALADAKGDNRLKRIFGDITEILQREGYLYEDYPE